jgi:hypothetical protein
MKLYIKVVEGLWMNNCNPPHTTLLQGVKLLEET